MVPKTQPLNVYYFRPVKGKWRSVLTKWKQTQPGPIRKDRFPGLLKQTLVELGAKNSDNIKAGFKATGLIPIDREAVLKRIPSQDRPVVKIANVFEMTRNVKPGKSGRRKKLNVAPGESISIEDLEAGKSDQTTMAVQQSKQKKIVKKKSESKKYEPSDIESEDNLQMRNQDNKQNEKPVERHKFQCGEFILVNFDTEKRVVKYVGDICQVI
ncbi:hypothetical protein JTB14_038227 [Gonioctena quinquepunctata]|nr:hypothetical protein JTB14_038227 [Gonioctena quinquepunctata]